MDSRGSKIDHLVFSLNTGVVTEKFNASVVNIIMEVV